MPPSDRQTLKVGKVLKTWEKTRSSAAPMVRVAP